MLVVGQVVEHRLGQLHVDIRPDVDDLVVTLVVRDQTHVIALHHLLDALVALVDERLFLLGDNHRVEVERQAALECHPVAERLDVVQKLRSACRTGLFHYQTDDVAQRTLRQHFVQITHFLRHDLVEQHAADRRVDDLAHRNVVLVDRIDHHFHLRMQIGALLVVGDDRLFGAVEAQTLSQRTGTLLGDIIKSEHHVLRRHRDRRSVGRVQDIVRTEHQNLRLQNGGIAQRQVHGHLIAVEVGVERRTSQRMQLQRLALDQLGLERLNTETVQRRGAVHQHRMPLDDILENIPNHRVLAVDDFLG